ncbi:disease resistance protein At4g27190 isoform X2 [Daucus carota subsp. sativus]|uniref:disease resistance protein At4g27190 isoform X2 n=1 Tax=Daucus carota subsp. sativus TaxID=79200 RepID=UPI003082D53A
MAYYSVVSSIPTMNNSHFRMHFLPDSCSSFVAVVATRYPSVSFFCNPIMVGLADIPFVGKFVERISDNTVDAVFRGLRYLFCYKALVDELSSETEKLNIEKDKMSRKVNEEKDNGKIIEDYVLKWQNSVEEIQKSDEQFSPSCTCIQSLPIPNPVSRFQQGRNAAKKGKTVTKLAVSGRDLLGGEIAHLPLVQNMPKSGTTFEEFQSRKDAYGKLWDMLVTDDSSLIHGIYGMPGVGKTRMMEKIWEDTMKEKIFNKVVRVSVGSEKLNKANLQDQIAARLDCKLEWEDVEQRASQLEESLRNGGKILLILDDVWREIPLYDIIGTSFGNGSSSKGSKILLTSRAKDACLINKCEHPVEVKTLSLDEGLYLFKNTVGPDTINSLQDESLVQKVCNECGQLPLLIHAVGKALKDKPHDLWEDAYNQLKRGKFENIVGVEPQVYACIKLSIDNLKHDDARSCLFLCSFFPEDANIRMKMLIQLATSSHLIPDEESRIVAMVHHLKTSSLLLDSEEENYIKVHDIIRDVARSIAFTDSKYAFLQVTCNSGYLPSNANYCTRKFLRLDVETNDIQFNEDLVCPDLHTLWIYGNCYRQQFTGCFFNMFLNLSFLMLECVNISLEQFSLQPLGNLETLTLLKCDIRKTNVSLFPRSLKTLCICHCDLPSPLDFANLKYLQMLKIQQHEPQLVMVSNAISSLSSLKDLHIPNGFVIDCEEYKMESIVTEIRWLMRNKAYKFDYSTREERVPLSRSIELLDNHSKPWEGLIARAEVVRILNSDVEMNRIREGHRRAFDKLRELYLYGCHKMRHLAQDEIQYSLQPSTCFSKLTSLEISACSKLKYLFCNNIAKGLVQLQEFIVEHCESMEAIIVNEVGPSDGEIINFSKLKSLKISNMPRLAGFYAEKNFMHSGLMDHPKVAFPSLEKLEFKSLRDLSAIWGKHCCNDTISTSLCKLNNLRVHSCDKLEILIPHPMLHRLTNLEYIKIEECNSLKTMFPHSVGSDLSHLKELRVKNCEELRQIFNEAGEQVITDDALFLELTDLELVHLPSLTSFWCYQSGKANTCLVPFRLPQLSSISLHRLPNLRRLFHGANFKFHVPALKMVEVTECGLSTLFTFSMFKNFQLQNLEVRNCELLENIVEDLRGDEIYDKIITLSQLTIVMFENLPNLRSFLHNANFKFHMPALKVMKVIDCGLSTLFTFSMFRNFQLNYLEVRNCELLENIVKDPRGDESCDKIITLSQLTSVHLARLPNLKCFFHGANYEFHMPVLTNVLVRSCGISDTLLKCSVLRNLKELQTLEVFDCELLEGIFEDARGNETSDISDRTITLSRLSLLHLENLPKLKSIFNSANYEGNLMALVRVKVVNCGLSTLFRCSVFPDFQQLYELEVVDCRLLEHIVENVKDETSDSYGILFPQLTILRLVNLPSLTSFLCYQSRKANTCKVAFRLLRLSSLVLAYLPDLKSFFHGANFEFHMPSIKSMLVRDSGLSSTLFTRAVFTNFRQLEELRVYNCELLEGIFEDASRDESLATSDKIITLDRLSLVHLQGLPTFKSFFFGATYECYMPALENVRIVNCGFSVLFTCSVFQEIRQLEILHVSYCELLERIVEEVGDEETSEIDGKSIESAQLSSITLKYLPNLKSFSCTSSYVFSMPKLKIFMLIKCPQIEYFSSSKTNTPFVRVSSDRCSEEDFQDLNDYIRQNYKGESDLSDSDEESSYSSQEPGTLSERIVEEGESSYTSRELGTQSEGIEEEKPQETETDLPDSSPEED